jgi:hypothetical protein
VVATFLPEVIKAIDLIDGEPQDNRSPREGRIFDFLFLKSYPSME